MFESYDREAWRGRYSRKGGPNMKWLSIMSLAALILAWTSAERLSRSATAVHLPQSVSQPALDQYGGLIQMPCENKTGHFILTKVGNRWWFCTPAGHGFISMNVGGIVAGANPTYNCAHQPLGSATSVNWFNGTTTYTFPTPLPSEAAVGSGLNTFGFSPPALNLKDAKIATINGGLISVAMPSDPGSVRTEGSGSVDANTYPIYMAKYGDTSANWGQQVLKRLTAWGFNSTGQDSVGWVEAYQTCRTCGWRNDKQPIPLPYMIEYKPAEYSLFNGAGVLPEPAKDLLRPLNSNYKSWRGSAVVDVFDPKVSKEFQRELQKKTNPANALLKVNDPWLLGIFTDDSDYFFGSGNGPDFITGHVNANIAYIVLISPPLQTFIPKTPFGSGHAFVYHDTEVYTKARAANPVGNCSIRNPCSLRDYLWQKYHGNIASLNAAWQSNYTTFDSAGVKVTGEVVGTGNGSTTTFKDKLSHASVSPYSVSIEVGGTPEIGDCPWFYRNVSCGNSTNRGELLSPTPEYVKNSEINYSNGEVSLTFVTPPAAGRTISINYIYNGWMSGGSGLMDESGSNTKWVGTNNYCLEGADPNYPAYFACTWRSSYGAPNANPKLGQDLDGWIPEYFAQFTSTMKADLRAVSQVPYLGLDIFGSWGAPAYSRVLEGAAPYIDAAFVQLENYVLQPSPTAFQAAYQYTTRYLGDVPLLDFYMAVAQTDSSYSCVVDRGDPFQTPNQAARGMTWYNTVNYLLTTPGYNGTHPFVGFDWWAWRDFQNLNQGLVSLHDNAYDGHEDQIARVPCSPPLQNYTCGGDTGNYGDAISSIRKGNAIWYKIVSH